MLENLHEVPKAEVTSLKTLRFRLIMGILGDQAELHNAVAPSQMIKLARDCTDMFQNKELSNSLRIALVKTFSLEYDIR